MELLLVLGLFIGSAGIAYVRDLRAAVEQLTKRGGLESALHLERVLAKVDLLALAVLADGEVTATERTAVAAAAKRDAVVADAAIARFLSVAGELRTPDVLREKIVQTAARLSADERIEVFVAVKNLAYGGGARAWAPAQSYRDVARPTPEALISIFREGLGIRS